MDYKAFLSYSHAAESRLAPALHSALQRFAKPWYRTRAVRIFRDRTNLSAQPQLWPQIEEALLGSEFFLLMASPLSAKSQWVAKEVETWFRENRPASRLLIVLTDGEITWSSADGDFDWERTTALPKGLGRRYQGEPFYVDLRWARKSDQFSARHPDFQDAVATIAAALNGRSKQDMFGEDVRQHRRTLGVIRGTVAVLAVLVALSTLFGIRSEVRRREIGRQNVEIKEQNVEIKKQNVALRQSLARAHAAAAAIAVRRANWRGALSELDAALAGGHDDPLGLRLERVKALFALYDVSGALRELGSVERDIEAARRPATARHRSLVLLWKGDYALARSLGSQAEGMELVRRASKMDLPGPELAYARGLLAATEPEAVGALREAVKQDPFHPRANAILAMFDLVSGRTREAYDRAVFARKACPEDPSFAVLLAAALALDGKKAEADAALAEARPGPPGPEERPRLEPGPYEASRQFVTLLDEFRHIDMTGGGEPGVISPKALASFTRPLALARRLREHPPDQEPYFLPIPPLLATTAERFAGLLPRVLLKMGLPFRTDAELSELSALEKVYPLAVLAMIRGLLLAKGESWEEAARTFDRAAESPSLLDVREPGAYFGALCHFLGAKDMEGPQRSAEFSACVDDLRKLSRLGSAPADHASVLTKMAMSLNQPELARTFIEGWEKAAPADPAALQAHAELELREKGFCRAIRLADKLLEKSPANEEARRIRGAAIEGLKGFANSVGIAAGASGRSH